MKKVDIFIVLLISIYVHAFSIIKSEIPKNNSGLNFKENKGQVSDQFYKPRPDVLFTGNAGDMVFHLRNNGISYQLYRVDKWKKLDSSYLRARKYGSLQDKIAEQTTIYRLDINWLNANTNAAILKQDALNGTDNYYSDVCPNGVIGVKSYKKITYQNLYSGIDLKWYEKKGNLKYDYIVAAGADYKQIQLEINGAEELSLNKKGELIIKTPLGTLTEQAPSVTQEGKALKAKWKIKKIGSTSLTTSLISFEIENIDVSKPFIIDPLVRLWGTYYGGNLDDEGWGIANDSADNTYVSGDTKSANNIATVGAYQTIYGGTNAQWGDAFLAKYDPSGMLLWSTYYGGAGMDFANMCNVDASGNNVVMVGGTTSTLTGVIATPGSYQTNFSGGSPNVGDAFFVMFNGAGVRQWGTYYGGTGDDWPDGCTFDSFGNFYVAGGSTSTSSIATLGSHQTTHGGGIEDGFLIKFTISGTLVWATYYGGSGYDAGWTCTVNQSGDVYLVGQTSSSSFIATPGSQQTNYGGGNTPWMGDGFIVKFNSGGIRQWASYYGGVGDDYAYNCVLDASGNIYIAGATTAPSATAIGTPGSHQPTYGGGAYDGFLLKLNPLGVRQWCTFYGGAGSEEYNYCGIDPSGNVYLTGNTTSSGANVISTPCAYQLNYGGNIDSYLAKFNSSGGRLWGTYYGGIGSEYWAVCSTDQSGNVYLTGRSSSSTGTVIASSGSQQSIYGGGVYDAFVAKFDGCIPQAPPNTTNSSSLTICVGKSTVLTTSTSCGAEWFNVSTGGTVIANGNSFSTPSLTNSTTYYIEETSCGISNTRTAVTVTILPSPSFSITATSTLICSNTNSTLTPVSASSYTWVADASLNTTIPSSAIATPVNTQTYYLNAYDGVCTGNSSIVINVTPTPTVNIGSPSYYLCKGNTMTLTVSGADDYTWTPVTNLNSPTGSVVIATPSSNITYSIIGSNVSGNGSCISDQESVTIYVVPYGAASISGSVEICLGSPAKLSASGGNIYNWWPIENMDDPNASIVNVVPASTTIYTVSVSNSGICPGTNTVLVKVNPIPFIDAGKDTTMNSNEAIFIAAFGTGTLTWTSGQNIKCNTCALTQVFPTNNSCYVVQTLNEFGCTASDQVCIEITNNYEIYIPNSFTPDGNGLNDEFKVYGDGITEMRMSIFDRWGKEVFISNDPSKGWNGKYKNEDCETGVYTYKIDYKVLSGNKFSEVGNITLLKN